PVLWDFPYNAGTAYTDATVANYDSPSTHTLSVPASASGTVFSLTYSRVNSRLYAAAQFKRHAGFGPGKNGTYNDSDDAGAIYVVNPSTSAVASVFTVPNAATNSHDVLDYASDNGNTGWDAVGKTSLGGLDISADESRLFVMNLQDRKLYALDPSTGSSIGSSADVSTLVLATPGGSAANCAALNIRPFAVKYYRGKVYVGVVCSAESTQSVNDLFAYIVEADPSSLAFSASPVFASKLNYTRGFADPGKPAAWLPWTPNVSTNFAYPQPMLADIEFDGGNMMLGMRDRAGDQEFDNGPAAKRTAGDTLKACGSFGSWTLESNGRCGAAPMLGSAPQNTNQGPGAGEFYYQDDFCLTPNGANYHDEVAWGSILFIPGRQDVMTTVLDPISRTIDSSATFDGGFRWLNNATGATDRAYRIYNGNGASGVPDFGKANGLGGTVAMCSPAPIEIGNRVWRDLNGNGVQDPGENGMANVQVHLYQGASLVGTAVTSANGEYYFVSSTVADANTGDSIGQVNGGIGYSTSYQVRFDRPTDFIGLTLTTKNQTSQLGDDTSSDSDGVMAGGVPVINLTTGGVGSNDHTLDVGFRLAAPTAANVTVGGRIILADGSGLRNAIVTLRGADGRTYTALSSSFGYYSFDRIEAGQSVIVSVSAKRFSFNPSSMLVNVTDNVVDLNFVAN
ncbi:MAG TPA: SdrD B-like domain-containing protein, partial [Pyrinomonadaceae bacterium]|nr:SdrD B-like domain-containing protein [Pyrinomonadaceae bacterium]